MKKPTAKRMGIGLAQHFIAAVVMLIIAAIVFNSYVVVESMNGPQTYMINTYGSEEEFEESSLFRNIFETAVADITRLVVIKGELETNGEFDPSKRIDVTEYANQKGTGNDCPVTVVYELDDLIKWGKSGIEYTNRPWSVSDFVNYYGEVNNPENFALDEYGELYFKGYAGTGDAEADVSDSELTGTDEVRELIVRKMQEYTEEQLNDMAFSYIVAEVPQGISMYREEDGSLTVYLTALNCRYDTVNGEKQLLTYADNWIDYMKLQNNLVDTITSLTDNYLLYQSCNELYKEGNSNLKYAVRMMTEDGLCTYTNVSELSQAAEGDITEYFSEYRCYSIIICGSMSMRILRQRISGLAWIPVIPLRGMLFTMPMRFFKELFPILR